MAKEEFAVEGTLVECTMSIRTTKDGMGDPENFKAYRIIHLGEVNNGVFGLDEAFLNEHSDGAELYIDPFPVCRSPRYASALFDIVEYLRERRRSSKDLEERERIQARVSELTDLAHDAVDREQQLPGDWQGPCVMELLDYWFNCSDAVRIDNFMDLLEELKEKLVGILADLDRQAEKVLDEAKAAMGDDLAQAQLMLLKGELPIMEQEKLLLDFGQINLGDGKKGDWPNPVKAEEEPSLGKEKAMELLWEYGVICGKLSRRHELKEGLENRVNGINLRYALDAEFSSQDGEGYAGAYIDEDKDELADEVEAIRIQIEEEVIGLQDEKIKAVVKKYKLEEFYAKYEEAMGGLFGQIQELNREASKIQEHLSSQAVVTAESYLVCRCGGRIKIVSGSGWVEKADLKVNENIISILLFAEEHIYGEMRKYGKYADQPETEDYGNSRYSTMIALNGLHVILGSMGVKGKYMDDSWEEDGENMEGSEEENGEMEDSRETKRRYMEERGKIRRYYPLPNISIDIVPQNEVEAREHQKAVMREVAGILPLGIKWFFKVLFFMEDMSNHFENEGADKLVKEAKGVLKEGGKDALKGGIEVVKKNKDLQWLGDAAGGITDAAFAVDDIISWCKVLQALMTKSYALFIGKITVEINTGWDKYTFEGNYNGDGERIGEVLYRSNYMGKDIFTNLRIANFYDEGNPYMFEIYKGEKLK